METKMTKEEAIKILMGYSHTPQERAALEVLIPELAESEDERIRKEIIEFIRSQIEDGNSVGWDRWIAYLEKQKEQKPAEWSEEDEEILKLLILNIGRYKYFGGMSSERILAFLKSLRPQYHGDVTMTEAYKMGLEAGKASHWKPSKKEITAFENMLKGEFPDKIYPGTTLSELLVKLKKLYYNESIPSWKPSEEDEKQGSQKSLRTTKETDVI